MYNRTKRTESNSIILRGVIMEKKITVTLKTGETWQVTAGTTLLELSQQFKERFVAPIALAIVDKELKELFVPITKDCHIEFIDTTHKDGYRAYERTLSFLLVKAVDDVFEHSKEVDVFIDYAVNQGLFCKITPFEKMPQDLIEKIDKRMHELVAENKPIVKHSMKNSEAVDIFKRQGMDDKIKLLKYRRVSSINLYEIDGFYDYFYGYMLPSTSAVLHFTLYAYDNGLILQHMNKNEPTKVAEFKPDLKHFTSLKDASYFGDIMNIQSVGDLNEIIGKGKMNDMILVTEALMEKQVAAIADRIGEDILNKKFVFIAGPSSSGKTTFAHRLSIQLRANGMNPHVVSVDNYFVDRELTPKDADGNYDFETLEAINVEGFNKDMMALLEGKTVDMPVFNFISGRQEYKGNFRKLEQNDILVIEGIHCLNGKLSYSIPEANKFKVYISALTVLNIDNHNRIPTTDARLLRRIVRDNQYRGADAKKTISMWPSVRRGEEKYIFPFQEEADVTFNSALIYELSVLKQYAEPLLLNVPEGTDEYMEAKRLVKFFSYFLGVSSESIPNNSLVREFIGGGCFKI